MKKLLILLLISICGIAWRSESIVKALTQTGAASAQNPSFNPSVRSMVVSETSAKTHPMTMKEYAALSKTDPNAYQKFLASHQVEEERSSLDKLMNFLAHGKYE